jgi:hypothetical protein
VSHVSKIELEIKDLEALKAACQADGFHFRKVKKPINGMVAGLETVHYPKVSLKRNWVNVIMRSMFPAPNTKSESSRKEIIYPALGFLGERRSKKHIGKDAGKLKQIYAVEKIRLEAQEKGNENPRKHQTQIHPTDPIYLILQILFKFVRGPQNL